MWKGALSLLATLAVVAAQTADDYKVGTLPGIDTTVELPNQYAGHIEIAPDTNSNLFFWMIEPTHETGKLILWLNGGPGCSSMDGLFLENGPYRVNPDLSVNISSGGWQDHATIVYLDQPVGTGFSFSDMSAYATNMTQIVDGFMIFLEKFFAIFPQLKEQDFYIAGESYAGTYIPYFTSRILELNKKSKDVNYNLKGIAIGNGWISPVHQYDAYYDFAVANDLLKGEYKEYASTHTEKCRQALAKEETIHAEACEQIMTTIVDSSTYIENNKKYCINEYDIRMKHEEYPSCGMSWPYDLADVTTYLRSSELVQAVHADKQSGGWTECSSSVSRRLDDDKSKTAYTLLPGILEELPVLLFSGDQDLICNVLGTQYMIGNMTWNGAKGLESAETLDWVIDDKNVGTYTEARKLTFVVIHDGSHMVPYDKPMETLDMINRFMGVGGNKINGADSRVGDANAPVEPEGEESNPPEEGSDEDQWSQYYSWGTSALVVVILFAAIAGYCWYRSRKQAREGYSRPASRGAPSSTKVFGGGFLGLFGKNKRDKRPKLRLDDQDDTNELDELVIETPTLFAAEEYSDDEHRAGNVGEAAAPKSKQQTRFAIAEDDDDDDDFEEFADWDEEPTSVDKKGDKRH